MSNLIHVIDRSAAAVTLGNRRGLAQAVAKPAQLEAHHLLAKEHTEWCRMRAPRGPRVGLNGVEGKGKEEASEDGVCVGEWMRSRKCDQTCV